MRLRLFLSLAAGLLLVAGLSCMPEQSDPEPLAEWVTNPTTEVFVNPKIQHVSQGSELGINVEVMPSDWGVSAGEITLSYDPRAFELIEVKHGDLLGADSLVGVEKIDRESGIITYALARTGATAVPGKRGVFISAVFRAGISARGGFRIDVIRAFLANEKFEEVKGLKAQGATIIVD